MKEYEFRQAGKCIADRVKIADTFMTRFFGLMPKKSLQDGEGLFLQRCSSIHCFFMKFPIDVIYLDKNKTVLAIETVRPWRIGGIHKGTRHVLELKEGAGKALMIGKAIEGKERDGI